VIDSAAKIRFGLPFTFAPTAPAVLTVVGWCIRLAAKSPPQTLGASVTALHKLQDRNVGP